MIAGTGATPPARPSSSPSSPARRVRWLACRSCLTTIARPRRACIGISGPSPRRAPADDPYNVPGRTVSRICPTTPRCAWPKSRTSSASRTPPATSTAPAISSPGPQGFRPLHRRRHDGDGLHHARRLWHHLGHRQRGAAPDARNVRRRSQGATACWRGKSTRSSSACIVTCSAKPTRSRSSGPASRWV